MNVRKKFMAFYTDGFNRRILANDIGQARSLATQELCGYSPTLQYIEEVVADE